MTDALWVAAGGMRTEALRQNSTAEVCVIGGGIAGLSVAHGLASEGRKVILLEGEFLGAGEIRRTSAHLSSALDDGFDRIESLHGSNGAALAYESHSRAIERIADIVAQESIDCDFSWLDGYLMHEPGADPETLDSELEAARRAGFAGVEPAARSC